MHHRMPPSNTGWPSLNIVIFPPVMRLVLDDPKQWPLPEIVDQIYEIILEDGRISAKSTDEQLGISRERVGFIIHEDLDMWELSAKWVPKCLNADQKRQCCQSSEQVLEFFSARSKWFPVWRDWWLWTKPGYITMARRQSNNQWSGGIVAHPARQKIRVQKSSGKVFASIFLGSRWHPPHWLCSKGPNYQRGVLLISAGAIEWHVEG